VRGRIRFGGVWPCLLPDVIGGVAYGETHLGWSWGS
jgi:hypothetical protein